MQFFHNEIFFKLLKLNYNNKIIFFSYENYDCTTYFFPWIGYFDMIEQVDLYVILDDVEFDYQSWQHRNNFKTSKGLSISHSNLRRKEKKLIKDVTIKDPSFAIKKFKNLFLQIILNQIILETSK